MHPEFRIDKNTLPERLLPLKRDWLRELNSPPDGMWTSFRENAAHWEIWRQEALIGYACIDDEQQLIQFYLLPSFANQGPEIFALLRQRTGFQSAMVGTNNPLFLSAVLHHTHKLTLHTYLFNKCFPQPLEERKGTLFKATAEDHSRLMTAYAESIEADEDWLRRYLLERIAAGESFFLESEEHIIGCCEVRANPMAPNAVDIGMLVHPSFRRQGYGTYLLSKARDIAIDEGKTPICSCERDNPGSQKSIQHAGFISEYQLLSVTFNPTSPT